MGKVARLFCRYPYGKKFAEIALSRTVSKINAIYEEIQDGCQKWRKFDFCEKLPVDSVDTLGGQNFDKIAQSCIVSEINALCFTQKLKIAAKNGGKMIFGKSRQSTLGIPWHSMAAISFEN